MTQITSAKPLITVVGTASKQGRSVADSLLDSSPPLPTTIEPTENDWTGWRDFPPVVTMSRAPRPGLPS